MTLDIEGYFACAVGIVLAIHTWRVGRTKGKRAITTFLGIVGCVLTLLGITAILAVKEPRCDYIRWLTSIDKAMVRPLEFLRIDVVGNNPLRDAPDQTKLNFVLTTTDQQTATWSFTGRQLVDMVDGRNGPFDIPWPQIIQDGQPSNLLAKFSKIGDFASVYDLQIELDASVDVQMPSYMVALLNGVESLPVVSSRPEVTGQGSARIATYGLNASVKEFVDHWPITVINKFYGKWKNKLWGLTCIVFTVGLLHVFWRYRILRVNRTENQLQRMVPQLEHWDRVFAMVFCSLLFTVFYALTYSIVQSHYETHLGHFDSVGTYHRQAEIVNVYREEGYITAFGLAVDFYGSWLQSMFAAAFAPVLGTHPADFQLLNTLCMAALFASMYRVCRDLKATRMQACTAGLIIFFPAILTHWDGGWQDMRRDPSFLALLGSSFFFALSQIWFPSIKKGICLGLVAGFCVWSRGNAFPHLLAILGPMVGVVLLKDSIARNWRQLAVTLGPALIVFVIVAGPNLAVTFIPSMNRYGNKNMCFFSEDPNVLGSLVYWMAAPVYLWLYEFCFAPTSPLMLQIPYGTLGFALAVPLLLGRQIDLAAASDNSRQKWLVAAGLWALVSTVVPLVLMGWDAGLGIQGLPPFFPTLLLPFSLSIVFISFVRPARVERTRALTLQWLGVFLIGAGSVAFCTKAMAVRSIEPVPEAVIAARNIVKELSKEDRPLTLAFMTFDTINYHSLCQFAEQSGVRTNKWGQFNWKLPHNNVDVDFACRVEEDQIEACQQAAIQEIRARADFVLVNCNLEVYRKPMSFKRVFLHHYCAPVASAILEDPAFRPVLEYELRNNKQFILFKNTRRQALPNPSDSSPKNGVDPPRLATNPALKAKG